MNGTDINNLRPHEKKLVKTYELLQGKIVVIYELQIKDIDNNVFIVAERAFLPTGKTKEELVSDLEAKKNETTELQQAEIDKINTVK